MAEIDRLRVHVKENILYYMQAIWRQEPPDQRFFRLYNIDVPDRHAGHRRRQRRPQRGGNGGPCHLRLEAPARQGRRRRRQSADARASP